MELDWTDQALAWIAGRAVELAAGWTATFTVVVVIGAFMFGRGYKKRIAALEARSSPPVTVNVLPEGRNRQGLRLSTHISLTVPGSPEERLRALVPALIPFVEKNLHTYDEIWEVHIALGELVFLAGTGH